MRTTIIRPGEAANRLRKAQAIADLLFAHAEALGFDLDDHVATVAAVERFTPQGRLDAAELAGVTRPSEDTWHTVVAVVTERLRNRRNDPLAGLPQ